MYEFNGEKIVLDELKSIFKGITLQSDFSDQYVLGIYWSIQGSISIRETMLRFMNVSEKIMVAEEQSKYCKRKG